MFGVRYNKIIAISQLVDIGSDSSSKQALVQQLRSSLSTFIDAYFFNPEQDHTSRLNRVVDSAIQLVTQLIDLSSVVIELNMLLELLSKERMYTVITDIEILRTAIIERTHSMDLRAIMPSAEDPKNFGEAKRYLQENYSNILSELESILAKNHPIKKSKYLSNQAPSTSWSQNVQSEYEALSKQLVLSIAKQYGFGSENSGSQRKIGDVLSLDSIRERLETMELCQTQLVVEYGRYRLEISLEGKLSYEKRFGNLFMLTQLEQRIQSAVLSILDDGAYEYYDQYLNEATYKDVAMDMHTQYLSKKIGLAEFGITLPEDLYPLQFSFVKTINTAEPLYHDIADMLVKNKHKICNEIKKAMLYRNAEFIVADDQAELYQKSSELDFLNSLKLATQELGLQDDYQYENFEINNKLQPLLTYELLKKSGVYVKHYTENHIFNNEFVYKVIQSLLRIEKEKLFELCSFDDKKMEMLVNHLYEQLEKKRKNFSLEAAIKMGCTWLWDVCFEKIGDKNEAIIQLTNYDRHGYTVLHNIFKYGQIGLLEHWRKNESLYDYLGNELDKKTEYNQSTAMYLAVFYKHLDFLIWMKTYFPDKLHTMCWENQASYNGVGGLALSVKLGYFKHFDLIMNEIQDPAKHTKLEIEKRVADILEQRDSDGENLIFYAIKNGNFDIASRLLGYMRQYLPESFKDILKTEVDLKKNLEFLNLMEIALILGHSKLVTLLIKNDIPVNLSKEITRVVNPSFIPMLHKDTVAHFLAQKNAKDLQMIIESDSLKNKAKKILKITNQQGHTVAHFLAEFNPMILSDLLANRELQLNPKEILEVKTERTDSVIFWILNNKQDYLITFLNQDHIKPFAKELLKIKTSEDELFIQYLSNRFFHLFKPLVTSEVFKNDVKEIMRWKGSNDDFIASWVAMKYPRVFIDILKSIPIMDAMDILNAKCFLKNDVKSKFIKNCPDALDCIFDAFDGSQVMIYLLNKLHDMDKKSVLEKIKRKDTYPQVFSHFVAEDWGKLISNLNKDFLKELFCLTLEGETVAKTLLNTECVTHDQLVLLGINIDGLSVKPTPKEPLFNRFIPNNKKFRITPL